jgi:hypothetical protein
MFYVYETVYFIRLLRMVPESYIRTRFLDPGGQKVTNPKTKKNISYCRFNYTVLGLFPSPPLMVYVPFLLVSIFIGKNENTYRFVSFSTPQTGSYIKTSHVRYIR